MARLAVTKLVADHDLLTPLTGAHAQNLLFQHERFQERTEAGQLPVEGRRQ